MKKIIIIILSLASLLGCDDRYAFIPNAAPILYINNSHESQLVDSVKTSLKHGNNPFELSISVTDLEKHDVSLSARIVSGSGNLKAGGVNVSGSVPLEGGQAVILFEGSEPGITRIEVTATDELQKKTASFVDLEVFLNMLPVADFTYANTKIDGPYYIELNPAKSYDKDRNQGGGIQAYHYTFIGTSFNYEFTTTTNAAVKANLPGPGGYAITLEVIDYDGGKSSMTKNITL